MFTVVLLCVCCYNMYNWLECLARCRMGLKEDQCRFASRIRKRDIKNLGRTLQDFISNLPHTPLASNLRDALLYAALQLSRYNKSQCQTGLSESYLAFPLRIMKLLNESFPEIEFEHFRMKWEHEREHSSLKRPSSTQPDICVYAANGDFAGIEETLQGDVSSVDAVDSCGRSALAYCCRHASPDHMTCLEILLQHSASMDLRDNEGVTALHWAAYTGNSDAVRSLLKHGASAGLTDKSGRAPLHMAAWSDAPRALQLLLQLEDIDTRAKDCRGLTPILWACARDNLDAVNALQLAESKATHSRESFVADSQGRTLAHWAAISPYGVSCLESLVSAESAALQDALGWTPLHYSALTGSQKSCEAILHVLPRDQIDCLTKRGFSALHIACYHGNGDVLDTLLSHGSDYLTPTPEGSSPLDTVVRLKLHYSQLVLEAHISQCRRAGTPTPNERPLASGGMAGIPNHIQAALTPTPPRSPKPPASPKKPASPLRHHLNANAGNPRLLTRSLPSKNTPPLTERANRINNVNNNNNNNNHSVSTLESSFSSQRLPSRSRPVSAKGRIRPVQATKRPSSPAPPPNGPLPPDGLPRSSTATPPSPQQINPSGMRRTLSFDLNLDMTDQFSALGPPPRPTAPTPPCDSDPDSVVISEASSSPPLVPDDIIASASSLLGLPIQKRHSLQAMSDPWSLNDSGFVSPNSSIPKSNSALSMRNLPPPLSSPNTLQYDRYNKIPHSPSPYNQALTLPNTPHSSRPLSKLLYDTMTNPTHFPPQQALLTARGSDSPRYKAWRPIKESLPSQRPVMRVHRSDARISSSHYTH